MGSARAKSRTVLVLAAAAAVGAMTVGPDVAQAADGTWTDAAGGLWGDTNNWTGGIVADAGGAASFNALNLAGDLTVTLDAPRTLSTLTVADTTVSSARPLRLHRRAASRRTTLTLSGNVTVTTGGISLGGTAVMSAAALNISAGRLEHSEADVLDRRRVVHRQRDVDHQRHQHRRVAGASSS